jgi:hypothetical protein
VEPTHFYVDELKGETMTDRVKWSAKVLLDNMGCCRTLGLGTGCAKCGRHTHSIGEHECEVKTMANDRMPDHLTCWEGWRNALAAVKRLEKDLHSACAQRDKLLDVFKEAIIALGMVDSENELELLALLDDFHDDLIAKARAAISKATV